MALAVFIVSVASCLLWAAGGVGLYAIGSLIGLWQGRPSLGLLWLRLPLIGLALLPGVAAIAIAAAMGMLHGELVLAVVVGYMVGGVMAHQSGVFGVEG